MQDLKMAGFVRAAEAQRSALLARMQAQRTELLTLLLEQGWRVTRIEEDLEWWADAMWQLESVQSPAGSRAYVTFLVDPQFEGNRKKSEAVWAVMASPFKPVSSLRGEHEFMLNLTRGWKDSQPAFFGSLSILRGVNKESPQHLSLPNKRLERSRRLAAFNFDDYS